MAACCERNNHVTLNVSELESHGTDGLVDAEAREQSSVAGRSPMQLAVARFRSDRLSMISLVVSAIIVLCAIAAPLLVATGVLHPNAFNQDLLGEDGVSPDGGWSGVSGDHWLGVEPGTGR